MALGEVDYGLMGLVGGMTAFISFFNSLMATAVSRFFAYSIGAAEKTGDAGLEECRSWFNVALLIHLAVPVALLLLGYPLGEWAIRRFLTIPVDRVQDCVWVWRFVCVSCFLTMIAVPFDAMYNAKQYIAELTIYTFVTTTLNAFFLYYMVTHPAVWLVKFALWTCLLGIAPRVIIAMRAFLIFPECKVVPSYMINLGKIKEVAIYAFYRFFGALGILVSGQGLAILVNKLLGPARNAAMNVAATVSGHSNSLSSSFLSALSPAITNAYGAGNMDRVHRLSFVACRLTAVMVLIFVLPLLLESTEVFRLWLKNPPEGCATVCLGLLLALVLENICCGHYIAIFANGNIKWYQINCLACHILVIPIAWWFMSIGMGLVGVATALVVKQLLVVIVRLYFGRRICGFSIRRWTRQILLPLIASSGVALALGFVSKLYLDASFLRVCATTVAVNMAFLPLAWFFIFDDNERNIIRNKIVMKFVPWRGK